jgi:hypothetical protein
MKKAIFILSIFMASCSNDEMAKENLCEGTKTYYQFVPAINYPGGSIPAKYEFVKSEQGEYKCDTKEVFFAENSSNYSHYKITFK